MACSSGVPQIAHDERAGKRMRALGVVTTRPLGWCCRLGPPSSGFPLVRPRDRGFQGSSRDAAVVQEIALALRDKSGMDPYTKGYSPEEASVSEAPSVDLVVRRGLNVGIRWEALRHQSCPSNLLEASRVAVEKAIREGHHGTLAPLPLFVVDARRASSSHAGSSTRDRVSQWLQSAEADEWRRDRKALFPGAALPAE